MEGLLSRTYNFWSHMWGRENMTLQPSEGCVSGIFWKQWTLLMSERCLISHFYSASSHGGSFQGGHISEHWFRIVSDWKISQIMSKRTVQSASPRRLCNLRPNNCDCIVFALHSVVVAWIILWWHLGYLKQFLNEYFITSDANKRFHRIDMVLLQIKSLLNFWWDCKKNVAKVLFGANLKRILQI